MSRGSLVLLTLMAAACFSDRPPTGLSTSGTDATATGTDATSTTTTTSATTTTGTTATTTATTGDSAPGTTSTGATSTGTTAEPGTTTTAPGTSTSTTTGGVGFPECEAIEAPLACLDCCHQSAGEWEAFRAALQACVCFPEHACQPACAWSLCNDGPPAGACLSCVVMTPNCVQAGLNACAEEVECAPFADCVAVAGCHTK